eukprot:36171-Amphidinium_carterae.1
MLSLVPGAGWGDAGAERGLVAQVPKPGCMVRFCTSEVLGGTCMGDQPGFGTYTSPVSALAFHHFGRH